MPNLGANDGALILPVSQCGYADYRPTIQAVGAITDHCHWLPRGKWDDLALWLGAKTKEQQPVSSKQKAESGIEDTRFRHFSDGGYAVFIINNVDFHPGSRNYG